MFHITTDESRNMQSGTEKKQLKPCLSLHKILEDAIRMS